MAGKLSQASLSPHSGLGLPGTHSDPSRSVHRQLGGAPPGAQAEPMLAPCPSPLPLGVPVSLSAWVGPTAPSSVCGFLVLVGGTEEDAVG